MDEGKLKHLQDEAYVAAWTTRDKADSVMRTLKGMEKSLKYLLDEGKIPPSGDDDFYAWLDNAMFEQLVHHLRHWMAEFKEKRAILQSHGVKVNWKERAEARRKQ